MGRQLHRSRHASRQHVAIRIDVVQHVGAIEEASVGQHLQCVGADFCGGRPIAARLAVQEAVKRFAAAVEVLTFALGPLGIAPFVRIAVMTDLVARVENLLASISVVFGDPAGNEEGGRHMRLCEKLEELGHSALCAIKTLRQYPQTLGVIRIAREPHGFGVEVESPGHGDARAVRPCHSH